MKALFQRPLRWKVATGMAVVAAVAVILAWFQPMSRSEAVRNAREHLRRHEPAFPVDSCKVYTGPMELGRLGVTFYPPTWKDDVTTVIFDPGSRQVVDFQRVRPVLMGRVHVRVGRGEIWNDRSHREARISAAKLTSASGAGRMM
jgi:hypothetical protein